MGASISRRAGTARVCVAAAAIALAVGIAWAAVHAAAPGTPAAIELGPLPDAARGGSVPFHLVQGQSIVALDAAAVGAPGEASGPRGSAAPASSSTGVGTAVGASGASAGGPAGPGPTAGGPAATAVLPPSLTVPVGPGTTAVVTSIPGGLTLPPILPGGVTDSTAVPGTTLLPALPTSVPLPGLTLPPVTLPPVTPPAIPPNLSPTSLLGTLLSPFLGGG